MAQLDRFFGYLQKNYLIKVNNGNTRTICEICSKFTIKHQKGVTEFILFSLLLAVNIALAFPL